MLTDRHVNIEHGTFKSPLGSANVSGTIERSSGALDLALIRSLARGARAKASAGTPEPAADSTEQTFAISGNWSSPVVARTGSVQP